MKTIKLWLCRRGTDFYLFRSKPVIATVGWSGYKYIGPSGSDITGFCAEQWLKIAGIRVRDGYCIPVAVTKLKTGFSFRTVGKAEKMKLEE